MVAVYAHTARLPDGWAERVRIDIDDDGLIEKVTPGGALVGATPVGAVIPAMPNLHSHAFQRAMAGLGERRTAEDDDFWSWREVMYRFLDRITPDDLEAIATALYVEMVEAGYGRVVEFHYVHNDPSGRPYADPLETTWAHVRAAETAGIGLTLAPVLYSHSNFGGAPPMPGQRRFIRDAEQYLAMLEGLAGQADVAVSLHSLRAVTPEQAGRVLDAAPRDLPVHIHVAEQTKEVDDCLAWSGQRPVEWLLDHVGLGERWRLVHATHMTPEEARRAAATGAVAVVCPTTEGNLGDGFFQADAWFEAGGRLGVGTDSHVTIDPREELRWFEYGRRLQRRKRGLAATATQPSPGAALWLHAAEADARGGGAKLGRIAPGWRADFLALDLEHPNLIGREGDDLFDGLVFVATPGPSAIAETWVGGRRLTEAGRHPQSDPARRAYADTLRRLLA